MLPPAFFANRVRTVAVICASLMGFLFYGTLFLMSLYFQQLRGWSPGSTGVALLPLTVGTLVGPFLIYRPLARRVGHPVLLVAGFACCALGVAVLAPTDARSAYGQIAFGLLLIGLASTVSFSALTSLLLASVTEEQSGTLLLKSSQDADPIDALRVATSIRARVTGNVARVYVTQTFTNPSSDWVEGL